MGKSKYIIFSIVFLFVSMLFTLNVFALNISINNENFVSDPAPVALNNRTYIPVRGVFEKLGAIVDWKQETKQILISFNTDVVTLQLDNDVMYINGKAVQMDVAPVVIDQRTMLPVRFPAEALGFTVGWDGATSTVQITNATVNEPLIDIEDEQKTPPSTDNNNPSPEVPSGNNKDDGTLVNADTHVSKITDTTETVIEEQKNSEVKITGITIPKSDEPQIYTITSDGPISKIEKTILTNNRIVIDIYNAELTMTTKTFTINDVIYLSTVRAGQNQVEPVKITRFVFDITSDASFKTVLSADRKTLSVSFDQNIISNVLFETNGKSDFIIIEGSYTPTTSLFPLKNPSRIVIDLPSSKMPVLPEKIVEGIFSQSLRFSQFEPEKGRVVADLKKDASYSVTKDGNRTIIEIHQPTYNNIEYLPDSRTIVLKKNGTLKSTNDIIQKDNYHNYEYTFTLPGDYSGFYGFGNFLVKDGFISNFEVVTQNSQTKIVVNEEKILAFDILEDDTNIYLKGLLPKEKYKYIVVIDPGHGAGAPGTNGFGIIEKDLNLDIGNKLYALLEADPNVKVYATRTGDVNPSLEERARFANEVGDLFVSIHNNAMTNAAHINGTETFYYKHANDDTIGITSEKVAEIFLNNLINDLGSLSRRHKSAEYVVLKKTEVPATLVEIGFLTNAEDAAKLATQEYRMKSAESLYKSIKEVFEIYQPKR